MSARTSNVSPHDTSPAPPGSASASPLNPEQQRRVDAFQALVREQRERFEKLSPEEQRAEEAAWEKAMETLNESRRGYRTV